jgi:hypothetical protein
MLILGKQQDRSFMLPEPFPQIMSVRLGHFTPFPFRLFRDYRHFLAATGQNSAIPFYQAGIG